MGTFRLSSISDSDSHKRVMSKTNNTSSSQSDPLRTILERLNRTVADVTKLRLFLGDLEDELNEIRQQCENELHACVWSVAAENAQILVVQNQYARLSMESESKSHSAVSSPILGLPPAYVFGGLESPSSVVKGGNGSPAAIHAEEQIPHLRPPIHPSPFPKNLDLASYPPEFKREGHDWFILFNSSSNAKQVLDINIVHQLKHKSSVQCVQFSQDEKWLATGCRGTAQIYNMNTGVKTCILRHAKDKYIWGVCFSPNGKYLATGADDKKIRIWNIAKKKIYKVFKGNKDFTYYSLCFFPNGRSIAYGSSDGSVYIQDVHNDTSKVLTICDHYPPPGHHHGVLSVAISPDGRYIAVGSTNTVVSIWDVAMGVQVQKLRGHKDCVYCISFTPDGKGLITGGSDETLKYWDVSGLGIGLDVTGHGAALARTSSTSSSPCLMNLTGHRDYYVRSTSVSHDGRWVISGSRVRDVLFWDTRTGVVQCSLSGHKDSVIQVDLSPKGNYLATASDDCQARIWSYKVLE